MHFTRLRTRNRAARAETRPNDDGSITVMLAGELDHDGVMDIENDVRWAVTEAVGSVALDCAAVTFVDSAGLRLVLQTQMMAVDRHLRFTLASPSDVVLRLLVLTGLDDVFEVA